MASLAEVAQRLRAFGVSGCHVRRSNIIGFSTQKWDVDDSMEPRETIVFFYYPDEVKAEQWAARELDLMTGIHGCGCHSPNERWVFVSDAGEVYVAGQGDDGDEKRITAKKAAHFAAVKCVAGGFAYAVGTGREVYRRVAANKWDRLTDVPMARSLPEDLDHAGFDDIDGFSDKDLYACGARGDLWTFDGKRWIAQDVPTDANLEKVLCAPDGRVYITTNRPELVVGRRSEWRAVPVDTDGELLEDIVAFDSRVLISTDDGILEFRDYQLQKADLRVPKMNSYSHMATGDGVLVVAGSDEAAFFDGGKWKKIY
jgi:hypothetical protein